MRFFLQLYEKIYTILIGIIYNIEGFRFGLQMFFFGYDALARFPVITCNPVHVMVFYFVPKLSGRLTASVSDDKIKELYNYIRSLCIYNAVCLW
ncbi:hypothetical protein Barb4_04884 [Bacteroidales bacterium Barb4]|nr:hypothetical protein Barb4_04884 [Bacteroidales bacterium Barb4]